MFPVPFLKPQSVRRRRRRESCYSVHREREREKKKKDGEDTGEDEGGGVRAVAVPAEGDAGSLEGSARKDPPQSHRELDQRHPPPRSSRRRLHVCPELPGKGEDGT
ncbi:unnamed protein product [Camellia sinensis]